MGFLRKFLIEEEQEDYIGYDTGADYAVPTVDVELDGVNIDTLIKDIYDKNNLSDTARSIFKVEEVMNSLPKEMATDTKRASVVGILASFGLTPADVTTDAESRAIVLDSALSKINEDGNATVSQKSIEIENYKMEIERLSKEIADENERMKVSKETIVAEIKRVTELVTFVGGE